MDNWQREFKYDPLPLLLSSGDEALIYFTRRDLLDERGNDNIRLEQMAAAVKILKKQMPDGSWPIAGIKKHQAINHSLIETWKQFRFLIEKYGMTREHPQIEKGARFLFSCQTTQGDIRGFLANQYATYYTGAILSLLISAGYGEDERVEKGLSWLLLMRQNDGGWTIPMLTHKLDRKTIYHITSEYEALLEPDRDKPFSHNWTGMVLRAFAHHTNHRKSEAALKAAELLKSRFFQPDSYTSYKDAGYWVRFEYPFWWNNLITAMDSLSLMGFSANDAQIKKALNWFTGHQETDGLWKTSYMKVQDNTTAKSRENRLWISLAICRIFKRIYDG